MNIESIRRSINNHSVKAEGIVNYFSVLIPLIKIKDDLNLLYEIRSHKLSTQPGEISFPGGRVEEGEKFDRAAVRETCEELNIKEAQIDLLGELDYIVTPYNLIIKVFAAHLNNINLETIEPNNHEVDQIFTVPLKFFQENKPDVHYLRFTHQESKNFPYHRIKNGKDYNWREGKYPVYFYQYKDYIIWGFTARMTRNFIEIINNVEISGYEQL